MTKIYELEVFFKGAWYSLGFFRLECEAWQEYENNKYSYGMDADFRILERERSTK